MKVFDFLKTANAFRWMYDNTTGKVLIWNFKKLDIMVVKRDETRESLDKKVSDQIVKMKQVEESLNPQWEW